jgi:hypothetical protein
VREYSFGRMLRSIFGRMPRSIFGMPSSSFKAHLACAVTGPKAGAQLACANLGRRAETSCLAENGPDYGAQIACASKHSAPSILMNGWEPNTGTTKLRQPPRVPQTLATRPFDPHPRRTHSDPMRAAPPRAPAPAPRTHPPQRRRPYQIPTPRLLPSLPPFPTAAAIQHRAGVELLAGGRVRLARGSFEEFITGAWRSAAPAGPASCGMPPLLEQVGACGFGHLGMQPRGRRWAV